MKAGVISSEFGTRGGRAHEGLDIAADLREPIYAAASGEVIYAGSGLSGYGNTSFRVSPSSRRESGGGG